MKTFFINLLLTMLAILVSAVLMTALASIYSESFMEVVYNFIGSLVVLTCVAVVTFVIAALVKGIKALFNINIRRSKPLTRTYTFKVWMKYWSNRYQKLLTTIKIEAASEAEAEEKARESYSKLLYSLERVY